MRKSQITSMAFTFGILFLGFWGTALAAEKAKTYSTIETVNRGEKTPTKKVSDDSFPALRKPASENGAGGVRERPFGLGVLLGEPTGLSAKYFTSNRHAVDLGLAWSFGNETAFHIHGDYLFHEFDLMTLNERPLWFFWGAGVRLKFEKKNRFGIRLPVGLEYHFERDPIGLFVELAPIVDLAPKTEVNINASLGARYFF